MKVKVTIGQRSGKRLALQKASLLPQDATLASVKPTSIIRKVMDALRHCSDDTFKHCSSCPYYIDDTHFECRQMNEDALWVIRYLLQQNRQQTTEWVHQEEDGDSKLILRCKYCGAKADCFVHGTDDWWPAYEPRYCPVCGKRSGPIGEYKWIVIDAQKADQLTVRCSDCGGFCVTHDYLMPPKECPHCGTMKAGIRFDEDLFNKEGLK